MPTLEIIVSECPLVAVCCGNNILLLNIYLVLRDSDKVIFERLQKEFEAARASQTEGSLDFGIDRIFLIN